MHEAMATALDEAIEQITKHQQRSRVHHNSDHHKARPRWPMILLKSPKGWTGPKVVDGKQIEGTFRAHQVPITDRTTHPAISNCLNIGLRVIGRMNCLMQMAN